MMLWPFTLFFSILMLSSNVFTFFLGFIPFIVLELYLSDRFEKRMQTYKPPKRYKALNHVSVYWLTIPTALIITAYFFAVLVLLMKYVIVPYELEGWLYNLLIQ